MDIVNRFVRYLCLRMRKQQSNYSPHWPYIPGRYSILNHTSLSSFFFYVFLPFLVFPERKVGTEKNRLFFFSFAWLYLKPYGEKFSFPKPRVETNKEKKNSTMLFISVVIGHDFIFGTLQRSSIGKKTTNINQESYVRNTAILQNSSKEPINSLGIYIKGICSNPENI